MSMKAITFYSDIYRQNFHFLKGWTLPEVEALAGQEIECASGVTFECGDAIFLWVTSLEGEGLSELVHECVHAANFTLGRRGIKVSAKQDEAQAYLVQWIFHNCYRPRKARKK